MVNQVQSFFRNEKQFRLFSLLCLSTIFNLLLVGVRFYYVDKHSSEIANMGYYGMYRGTPTFLFLVWNLFLAWIPYWISLSIEKIYVFTQSFLKVGICISVWLLFLPNAPYILTDLLHLKSRSPIPHWYDLMMIVSFAWTGLMLGLFSLYEIQLFFQKRVKSIVAWSISIGAITLCSFGIYIGRYLRWNSWDVLTNPIHLFKEIGYIVLHPFAYANTLGIAVVLFGFLLITYLTMATLISDTKTASSY